MYYPITFFCLQAPKAITGDVEMTEHEPGTATMPAPSPSAGLPKYPSQSGAHSPYAYPSRANQQPLSQTTAVWAFVLAVVPIPVGWLVSIGLAISVVSKSRDGRGRERGRGMAIAALVIAPLWIAAFVALMAATSSPGRDVSGQVTTSGDASVTSLKTGDCLAQLPGPTSHARTVKIVPCSHKHAAQVFAHFAMPNGAYPGNSDVVRMAEGGCIRRFDEQFSQAQNRDQLHVFYYYPLEDTWHQTREVTCVAATVGSNA
jgi:hypothetical protein